ncbi:MAG: hypothetical protein SGCHY_000185 [Lobulomycetales sp.]
MTSETRDSGFAGAMQRVAPPQKAPAKDANDPLHQHVNSFLRLSLREQRRILIDFFTKSPKRVLVVTNPDIPKRIKSNPQVNVDEKSKGANESIFRKAYRASTAPLKSAQNIYSIAAGAEIAHSLSDEKGFSLTRLVCRTAFHPVDSAIGLSHNILDAALRGKQKTEDDELACSDSEDSECEENCDNDHHLWPQHIDTRTEEAMREELSVGNEASGTILSEPSGEVRSQINVRTFASQFLSVGAQAAETVWVVSTAPVAAVYCTGKRLISNVGNRFKPVSEKPATDDSDVLELPGSAARAREHSSSISTIPNDNVSAASFVYSNVNTGSLELIFAAIQKYWLLEKNLSRSPDRFYSAQHHTDIQRQTVLHHLFSLQSTPEPEARLAHCRRQDFPYQNASLAVEYPEKSLQFASMYQQNVES